MTEYADLEPCPTLPARDETPEGLRADIARHIEMARMQNEIIAELNAEVVRLKRENERLARETVPANVTVLAACKWENSRLEAEAAKYRDLIQRVAEIVYEMDDARV
jgi:hypothetical protein